MVPTFLGKWFPLCKLRNIKKIDKSDFWQWKAGSYSASDTQDIDYNFSSKGGTQKWALVMRGALQTALTSVLSRLEKMLICGENTNVRIWDVDNQYTQSYFWRNVSLAMLTWMSCVYPTQSAECSALLSEQLLETYLINTEAIILTSKSNSISSQLGHLTFSQILCGCQMAMLVFVASYLSLEGLLSCYCVYCL